MIYILINTFLFYFIVSIYYVAHVQICQLTEIYIIKNNSILFFN